MSDNLRYFGSWKGKVIKAITVDGDLTFQEIMDRLGIKEPKYLNEVLSQLYTDKAISLQNKQYNVVDIELKKEYISYYKNINNIELKENNFTINKHQQNNLISSINQWKGLYCPNITLDSGHFYLDDKVLDNFSNFIVEKCQNQILIVNPFVSKCHLSEALIHASREGKEVKLLTRPVDSKSYIAEKSEDYHKNIKQTKIKMFYNKEVHAKMLVVDQSVAIISSMNLGVTSTGGGSWEAGIVSIKDNVVDSIVDSIQNLIAKPESKVQ